MRRLILILMAGLLLSFTACSSNTDSQLEAADRENIGQEKDRENIDQEKDGEEEGRGSLEDKISKLKGIGHFGGYWLLDTMACHITDTYFACALAESDFIVHEVIKEIEHLSDTKVKISFANGETSTFKLIDDDHLELADGVYERVTEKKANAIYGGYYELP